MKRGFRPKDDPFRESIRKILLDYSGRSEKGAFRSRVFAEIQDYSKELQDSEHTSDFFFRMCELVVDCQSLDVPDDSFKIVVAHMLHEFSDSITPPDEEIRQVIGMDPGRFELAKEKLQGRECISLLLDNKKAGKKGNLTNWKRSQPEAVGDDF